MAFIFIIYMSFPSHFQLIETIMDGMITHKYYNSKFKFGLCTVTECPG